MLQPEGNELDIWKAWDLVADFRGMDRTHQVINPQRSPTAEHTPDVVGGLPARLGYAIDSVAARSGRTPLHLAAAAGDSRACKALIESGYAVTDVDVLGRSAAAFARSAGHFELAAALEGREETPAEIVARRPLNLAELNGLVADPRRTLERLIGANRLAARDVKGDSALHIVAMQGNLWATDMLVHAGADLHAMNLSGMTPEQVARANGHAWLADQLRIAVYGPEMPTGPTVSETVQDVAVGAVHFGDGEDSRFELESFDDGVLDDLTFDSEVEAEEFHQASGIDTTSAEFLRVTDDVELQFNEAEADFDWDFDYQARKVEGEGIKSEAGPDDEDVETYARKPHRTLRREIKPSTWNRFWIDPEACSVVVERIVANGSVSDEDIDEILGSCHGRFDPEGLRLNVIREIEAAGYDLLSVEEQALNVPNTDVSPEELIEAIVSTCTLFARLPGTRERILDIRTEKPLTDAVSLARRKLLLGIAEHVPVLDIVIYMSEQVLLGKVDCGEVTHLQVSAQRRNSETECFFDAVESLRMARDRIAAGSGSAVRNAVERLSDLELRPEFLKSVIAEMRSSDEFAQLVEPLARGLEAVEASSAELVKASLPRCRRHAAQRTRDDEDQEDVFQASFFGLQRSVATFDPSRGNFSTHSSIWMMQALNRWRSTESRLVRLPVHLEDRLRKQLRAEELLNPSLSSAERETALSRLLETTVDDVRRLDRIPQTAIALSDIEAHGAEETSDGIPESIHAAQRATVIRQVLSELDPRKAEILHLRFGFGSGEGKTLEEVGQIYGVTRERIRQIEAKAIKHLRHPVRLKLLERAFR